MSDIQTTGTGTWKHAKSTFHNIIPLVSLQSNIYISFLGQGLGWSGNFSSNGDETFCWTLGLSRSYLLLKSCLEGARKPSGTGQVIVEVVIAEHIYISLSIYIYIYIHMCIYKHTTYIYIYINYIFMYHEYSISCQQAERS